MKNELQSIVSTLFHKMDLDLTQVSVEMLGEGEYYMNIESDDAPLLTMWNGDVMRALQHLLHSICRSQNLLGENDRLKIDVGGFRKKQEESVIRMAEEKIKKALETQSTQLLPPMSPYFRRLVHVHITNNHKNVATESAGEGDQRHIRIKVVA